MLQKETVGGGAYTLFYDDALFKPGTDSFLLGAFVHPRRGDRTADLGAGCGLLGLLLFARESSITLTNIELRQDASALAERSFSESGLAGRCSFICGDLRDLSQLPPANSMDYVVSNPPYFPAGSGAAAAAEARRAARSEESCTLEDVTKAAGYLLRWGGRFAMVHRAERLTDVLCALRAAKLEPKRLRLVQHSAESAPSLLLVEAVRGGKSGLAAEKPLILRNADGSESDELKEIYFRKEN